MKKGCGQGCGYSPTRFCLVLEMFIKWVESKNFGYILKGGSLAKYESKQIPIIAFMDDIHLIGNTREEVQQMTNMLVEFLSNYGMQLSKGKCKYVCRDPSANFLQQDLFFPGLNNNLQFLKDEGQHTYFKSLGLWINLELDWSYHYKELFSPFLRPSNRINKGFIGPKDATTLVNSDIASIFDYSAQLVPFTEAQLKKVTTTT